MDNAELLKLRIGQWQKALMPYCRPSIPRATYQLVTTLGAWISTVTLMMLMATWGHYWFFVVESLAILAGGLTVRLFTIQHDCGHQSFFPSKRWNAIVGHILSVITITPYGIWKTVHWIHHSGSACLEKRGNGDIELKTVREYMAMSKFEKCRYRIMRNPFFLFLVGGPAFFLLINRSPWGQGLPAREAWRNTLTLNIMIVLVFGALSVMTSISTVLLVFLPIAYIGSIIGVWLFYVQHQFDRTRWDSVDSWDPRIAAVYGSSYYKLPRLLAWFTGDIGVHHVHHLLSRIPNYHLRSCLKNVPELADINCVTLWRSFACVKFKLWDEDTRQLVGFPKKVPQ